jgi:hypothetical protein
VSNAGNINGNVILGDFANSVTLLTGGVITGTLNVGSAAAASLTLDGAGSQLLSQAVTGTIGGFNSLTKLGTGTCDRVASIEVVEGIVRGLHAVETCVLPLDSGMLSVSAFDAATKAYVKDFSLFTLRPGGCVAGTTHLRPSNYPAGLIR